MGLNRLDTLWYRNNNLFKIVDTLPQVGQSSTIYLIQNGENSYKAYIYINGEFSCLGDDINITEILNRLTTLEFNLSFIDL